MVSEARIIELHYRLEPELETWVLPEVSVPESRPHDLTIEYLRALLAAWVARSGRPAIVARNLALRWVARHPQVGIDPDLCLIEPAPPDADRLSSLCLWKPGHVAPRLAIEVVSESHPYKDYADVHEKYAACGVPELWVLDPLRIGPKRFGGPFEIQIWQGNAGARFERVYQGAGPVRSVALQAWLRSGGGKVSIADDEAGAQLWVTTEEAARGETSELRERVRELEAELAGRR